MSACLHVTSHFGYDLVRDICTNGLPVKIQWGASDWIWNVFGLVTIAAILAVAALSLILTGLLLWKTYRIPVGRRVARLWRY